MHKISRYAYPLLGSRNCYVTNFMFVFTKFQLFVDLINYSMANFCQQLERAKYSMSHMYICEHVESIFGFL